MRRAFLPLLMILATTGLAARPGLDDTKDLKGLFNRSCAVCHGEDGSARGPNGQKLGGRDLANARGIARW